MRKFLIFATIALLAFTSIQLWMFKDRTMQKHEVDQEVGVGEAQIGGAFTLVDQDGRTVKESDFRGKVMLVFFGFTHCPDICPVTVANLSKTMTLLGPKADKVAPVFITVDPQRDTPPVLKDYLANFDKRIVALTGTSEQVKDAAALYKAYFAKSAVPEAPKGEEEHDHEHHQHGPHGADADYTMDHSGYIYLMDENGKYIRLFPYNADPRDIASAVEAHLNG